MTRLEHGAPDAVEAAKLAELRERPCRQGHSRHDAFVCFNGRLGIFYLACRLCHRVRVNRQRLLRRSA